MSHNAIRIYPEGQITNDDSSEEKCDLTPDVIHFGSKYRITPASETPQFNAQSALLGDVIVKEPNDDQIILHYDLTEDGYFVKNQRNFDYVKQFKESSYYHERYHTTRHGTFINGADKPLVILKIPQKTPITKFELFADY